MGDERKNRICSYKCCPGEGEYCFIPLERFEPFSSECSCSNGISLRTDLNWLTSSKNAKKKNVKHKGSLLRKEFK